MKTTFEISKWVEDPRKPGENYVIFDRNCSISELLEEVITYLKNYQDPEHGSIYNLLDYIAPYWDVTMHRDIPCFRNIYSYPVEGSSEGYYFHVAIQRQVDCKYTDQTIIIGKTLMGLQEALSISNALNSFILQST